MTNRPEYRTREAVSAGGIVHRWGEHGVEVVMLKTSGGVWGLPKGTPDDGETLSETALREVREETGLEVSLEEKVGTVEYWFAVAAQRERFHKYVHFWLMRPAGGSLDQHDHEHVNVEWLAIGDAMKRATHTNSAAILRDAATLLEQRDNGSGDA